jgi:hypothetical protein
MIERIALGIAVVASFAWLYLAYLYATEFHDWLALTLGDNELRLGESGDYLTGWVTPVAFLWFVVAIFMQRSELINQRRELALMREQYKESTEAAREQVSHLRESSLVAEKQMFMKMLEESKLAVAINAHRIVSLGSSIQGLTMISGGLSHWSKPGSVVRECAAFLTLNMESIPRLHRNQAADDFMAAIYDLLERHLRLEKDAERARLTDFYRDYQKYSPVQELIAAAERVLQIRQPPQPAG